MLDSEHPLDSCGGRTRTCDLQVMSLASYQLLHSAILLISAAKLQQKIELCKKKCVILV